MEDRKWPEAMRDEKDDDEKEGDSKTPVEGYWRKRSIYEFKLLPLPGSASRRLTKLSQSNEETWKRYYSYRIKLQTEQEQFLAKSDDHITETNEEIPRLRRALQGEISTFCKETPSCQMMDSHVFLDVTQVLWVDSNKMRSYGVLTKVFSPYALPHVVELDHDLYHRHRQSSVVEFHCLWRFNLLRFDPEQEEDNDHHRTRVVRTLKGGLKSQTREEGVYIGDAVTRKHCDYWKKGHYMTEDVPVTYCADEEMEILCCNRLMDPPNIRGLSLWQAIENIRVSNFTPSTIGRIRTWLLGSPWVSDNNDDNTVNVVSQFDFLRLLFACFGCRDFSPNSLCQGNFGYEWSPDHDDTCNKSILGEMEEYDPESTCKIGWLEYQARLIGGALRPIDLFYKQYDELADRNLWGQRVLAAMDEGSINQDSLIPDDDELRKFEAMPWLLWDRAKQNESRGGVYEITAGMVGMMATRN